MNILDFRIGRPIALTLVLFLICPIGAMASGPSFYPQQQAGSTGATQTQQGSSSEGANGAASTASIPTSTSKSANTAVIDAPSPNQQATESQNTQTVPAGTAAAPYEKQEGIPASRPAGAAIAPAKQRHIHSFAIRAGLIVGAAVAIGVITAVSLSSPSRAQ